jgi:hypothetical protein
MDVLRKANSLSSAKDDKNLLLLFGFANAKSAPGWITDDKPTSQEQSGSALKGPLQ